MGLEGNTVRNLEGRKKSPTLLITTTSSKWLRLSHKKIKIKIKKPATRHPSPKMAK